MQKLVILLHLLLLAKAKALLVLQLDFLLATARMLWHMQQLQNYNKASLLYCIQIQKLATAAQLLVLSN